MSNTTPTLDFYDLLAEAIVDRKCLSFTYEGGVRIVEPFKFGMLRRNAKIYLEAWQISGYTRSGHLPPWRLYQLTRIKNCKLLDIDAQDFRPGYKVIDQRMSVIIYAHCPEEQTIRRGIAKPSMS